MTHKVLMVCLGNICRSPIAEGILKEKARSKNLDVFVDSAGTSGWHAGELPDQRSIEIMKAFGIDITDQRSRPFRASDFETFDLILAMDRSNYNNLLAMARNDADRNKVKMVLEYTDELNPGEVPDPYYGEGDGFRNVYEMLDEALESLAQQLN